MPFGLSRSAQRCPQCIITCEWQLFSDSSYQLKVQAENPIAIRPTSPRLWLPKIMLKKVFVCLRLVHKALQNVNVAASESQKILSSTFNSRRSSRIRFFWMVRRKSSQVVVVERDASGIHRLVGGGPANWEPSQITPVSRKLNYNHLWLATFGFVITTQASPFSNVGRRQSLGLRTILHSPNVKLFKSNIE